jgi:hypothetical protein
VAYTGKSKERNISWTSHHWDPLIDMLSKSNRNLRNRVRGSLSLQIWHNRRMVNVALTHITKDKVGRANLKKTNPSRNKRRVMRSQRRTLESGVSSTKFSGTTLMNVAQNSHCWSSLKKNKRTMSWNLIQSRKRESELLIHNLVLQSQLRRSN